MFHVLKKKGVWIFLVTVALFFQGQRYLSVLAKREAPPIADSSLGFDAQGIHTIRIEKNNGLKPELVQYRGLGIRMVEPATHVAATFNPLVYELKSRVEGDVLVLTFNVPNRERTKERRYGSGGQEDQILVPSSIQNIEFVNVGRLKVSTETPKDLAVLNVRFADCPEDASFESVAVEKMTVTSHCQPSRSKDGRRANGSMRWSHVKAASLEITSTHGHIDFEDLVKAGTLQLNLADDVTVKANAALLHNARFGTAPP